MNLRRFLRRFLPTITVVSIGSTNDLSEAQRTWSQEREAVRTTLANVYADESTGPYTCPCCGHRTLPSRGSYDLCPECNWEDDGQDDHDSAVVRYGPNGGLSLDDARARYRVSGGRVQRHSAPNEPRGVRDA